jgi:hypothetical protein
MSDPSVPSPIAEDDENYRQGVQQPRRAAATLYVMAILTGTLSLTMMCGVGDIGRDLLYDDNRGELILAGLSGAGMVSAFVLGALATLLRWAAAMYAAQAASSASKISRTT